MAQTEEVVFPNNRNEKISARIYRGPGEPVRGLIYCHGLFSNKDGYKITKLADSLVSAGSLLLVFDFSFSGGSSGSIAEISVHQEVEDLGSAVRFFRDRTGLREIHVIGSSMGGAVGLLYAARNGYGITSLVTIAAAADLPGLADLMFTRGSGNLPPREGCTVIEGHEIRNRFYYEMKSLDMPRELKKIGVPVLAIHGEKDEIVSTASLSLIRDALPGLCRAMIIEKGDHTLVKESEIGILRDSIISWITGEHRWNR